MGCTVSAGQNVPHSLLSVWVPASQHLEGTITPPDEAVNIGALNAQDAWWLNDNEHENSLVVVWSTGYVHPMGSVVGANADNACYFIASYDYNDFELNHYTGPFYGKVQTVSPTACGMQAAVLIRNAPIGNGPGSFASRSTRIHTIDREETVELDHSKAIGYGRSAFGPILTT